MNKIKLRFAGLEVEFVDRDYALRRVEQWAEKNPYPVQVIFGPEGCGKSAWLKQSAELLKELDFDVVYIDPLNREFLSFTDLKDLSKYFIEALSETFGVAQLKLATLAIDFVKHAIKMGKKRIAVLVDDVFQAIGLDKAATYVKSLLNLIEYPPGDYDKIIVVVTTSEGLSRKEIGRHRWAHLLPMWNMSIDGFKELYNQIPGDKLPFEEIWRVSGGNPWILGEIFINMWNIDKVIDQLIMNKDLMNIVRKYRNYLTKAVEDPDNLWLNDTPEEIINELIAKNLIVYNMYERDPYFWLDIPPPVKDLELGIGRFIAWQTPLHKKAVEKCLKIYKSSS